MSKAKELAKKVIEEFEYTCDDPFIWLKKLANDVLSEPDPLKGWIEVDVLQSDDQHKTQCVNLAHITDFGTTPRGPAFINLIDSNTIIVKESYDSIKQKIKEAS